ncbi:MAG: caspase family protein [Spirochaetaceae bacterium]
MKKNLSLIFIFLLISISLYCQEPPSNAILRPNLSMHSSRISRIDTNGQFIVTASDDKTAKLWDGETGEYIRTFRVPIDQGRVGEIYACAISPDGNTVVVAGYSEFDTIYFFNTYTGKMISKIDGMGNVIKDLEYSKDGRYIAAAIHGKNDVRIFSATTLKLYKSLSGNEASIINVDFDNTGRFATVSDDRYIRLYDKNFNLLKKIITTGGNEPSSISFSPVGGKIAIGYFDSSKIQVLDSLSLKLLYEPDNSKTYRDSAFSVVCWSTDGEFLFAGGTHNKVIDSERVYYIRKYNDGGKGPWVDFKTSYNTIKEIKLIFNDIVFATTKPNMGRMDYYGNVKYDNLANILNFNNYQDKFFSLYPNSISFGPRGIRNYTFNVKDQKLSLGNNGGNLPKSSKNSISITNWRDQTHPKINGKRITFQKKYEIFRNVSITDKDTIIWGTSWNIYHTDKEGNLLWKKASNGEAFGVNTLDNIVVVSSANGTISWYRLSDGKELMTLLVNNDMKRWVLWTPEGYFTCSPGGQDLIGWHKNNGVDHEADFFPASRFAERFYRPDILSLVLKAMDTTKAIVQANSIKNIKVVHTINDSLPPVVQILDPSSGVISKSKDISFTVSIKSFENSPVTETKILLNGRIYEGGERGFIVKARDDINKSYNVSLEPGENKVSFLAKNNSGWSEASTVNVIYKYNKKNINDKPKLYILAVGVSDYADRALKLKYPAKDANDFTNVMMKQIDKVYSGVETKLITNAKATKDNILDGLDWIQKETTSKDIAMIFVAGHGMNDESGYLYYLPQDVELDRLRRTGLPAEEITRTISSIQGKVIYFMDTCHSGNLKIKGKEDVLVDTTKVVIELTSAENGAIIFASSTGRQYSLESDKWQNGAFTKALVEGLSGKADYTGRGNISFLMLDLYLSERVKELTGGSQTPTSAKPDMISDFSLAIK